MSAYLLDASVLIPLTIGAHENHERARRWLAPVASYAICPIVEGALVRTLVRLGDTAAQAGLVIRAIRTNPRCAFWPATVSYADVDLGHVRGHRQVTDAYLVGLARANGARLATLDEALATAVPDTAYLVPELTR